MALEKPPAMRSIDGHRGKRVLCQARVERKWRPKSSSERAELRVISSVSRSSINCRPPQRRRRRRKFPYLDARCSVSGARARCCLHRRRRQTNRPKISKGLDQGSVGERPGAERRQDHPRETSERVPQTTTSDAQVSRFPFFPF